VNNGAGEVVVAVTSEGDRDCVTGAVSTRVSAYASFLAPWLEPPAAGGCSASPGVSRASDGVGLALVLLVAVALRWNKRRPRWR
jgi:hypothetical protein